MIIIQGMKKAGQQKRAKKPYPITRLPAASSGLGDFEKMRKRPVINMTNNIER